LVGESSGSGDFAEWRRCNIVGREASAVCHVRREYGSVGQAVGRVHGGVCPGAPWEALRQKAEALACPGWGLARWSSGEPPECGE
jgi:hypothetical protein